MQGLNWFWIASLVIVAPVVAILFAAPFWRKVEMIFGNIVGTVVIGGWSIALIFREYVEVDRVVQACIDAGKTCWPEPSAETRFAIYACLGMFEIILLFAISLTVERRLRNREYAVEWRR